MSLAHIPPFWSQEAVVLMFGWQVPATFWRVAVQLPRFAGQGAVLLYPLLVSQTAWIPVSVFFPLIHSLHIAVFDVPSVIMARVMVGPSFNGGL